MGLGWGWLGAKLYIRTDGGGVMQNYPLRDWGGGGGYAGGTTVHSQDGRDLDGSETSYSERERSVEHILFCN